MFTRGSEPFLHSFYLKPRLFGDASAKSMIDKIFNNIFIVVKYLLLLYNIGVSCLFICHSFNIILLLANKVATKEM